ncbi:S49 family peptidase [Candidatus Bathyarchaeota archaeon]|nr:S49 family peptidase [Candidatus Bathyarchaeota archaeon]
MSSLSIRKVIVVTILVLSGLLLTALGYSYLRAPEILAPRNLLGVIRIEGSVLDAEDAEIVISAINEAITNSSIKAIVVRIDSPGGYADLVEQIYMDLLELKKSKPVVASITSALSGGYYIVVAADYLYALPTSLIGNVGVIGVAPGTLIPSEDLIETGALKVIGFNRLLFPFNISRALENFASAVENNRGDKLKIGPKELRRGGIYLGVEALKIGLIDELGSFQKAVETAAEMANIKYYEIVEVKRYNSSETQSSSTKGSNTRLDWISVDALNMINPPPAIYYLYLPSLALSENTGRLLTLNNSISVISVTNASSPVIVDLSHGNLVSEWEFDVLAAELAKRGLSLVFLSSWDDVVLTLDKASGLIVAAPTKPYTMDEILQIKRFVEKGRTLLLFFDPSAEYQKIPELLGPINSIANGFGISFAKGYLYNEDENYGLYRNIYIKDFENTSLTRDLKTIVLFTATHIHSLGSQAAWSSSTTYSSTAEKAGIYAPIVVAEDWGTVAAFGDITFMMEPFCYVEDNYKLVLNIVSKLTVYEPR